jgi:hypothetical protein
VKVGNDKGAIRTWVYQRLLDLDTCTKIMLSLRVFEQTLLHYSFMANLSCIYSRSMGFPKGGPLDLLENLSKLFF